MKLRIKGNLIRLRLTQGEVAQLAAGGRVENVVSFASAELRYAVVTCNRERVEADLTGNELVVSVPADSVVEWAGSDLVGIEDSQAVRDGELHILIEKDFACLKLRAGEDDAETFANPLAAKQG